MNVTHSTESVEIEDNHSMEIEDNHSYTHVTTNLYNFGTSKDCSTDSLPSQGVQARLLECEALGSLYAHEL